MEGLEKRIDKIEANCPAQVLLCRENFMSISDRLTNGAVKFKEHDVKIDHLEQCADSVKNDVNDMKKSHTKILAGIVVACILIAVNASLLLIGG